MFPFLTRSPRAPVAPRPRRVRPVLESLETRDCPAVAITGLTAVTLPGHPVRLTGTVTDDNPSDPVSLTFGGVTMGNTDLTGSGNFTCRAMAMVLGTATVTATDNLTQQSGSAQVQVSAAPPSLTLNLTYISRNNVMLSGTVTADAPGGLTVTLTGVVSGSTITNADGTFQVTLAASGVGQIQATVTDQWAQVSPAASVTVHSNPPAINNFTATLVSGTTWTFSGTVSDADAPGLMVQLGGLPSLQGKSATVASDCTFSITITLAAGETGTASAQCTNWFGVQSTPVYYLITY